MRFKSDSQRRAIFANMFSRRTVDKLTGFHVTDDPSIIKSAIESDKNIDETRMEGKVGDLGSSGLYISEYPNLWMGRSTKKYEFLSGLSDDKKLKLAEKIKSELLREKDSNYISEHEYSNAIRNVDDFMSSGGKGCLVILADQPYNIKFYEKEFLRPLEIEQTGMPRMVYIEAEGKFADITDTPNPSEELIVALKNEGYTGAFHGPSFVTYPQAVIWDKKAIKKLEEMDSEFARKGKPTQEEYKELAIKEFGETHDPLEVGYIFPDGTMLDFSGKIHGGSPRTRAYDHRQIGAAFEDFDDVKGGTEGMWDFMENAGAVRISVNVDSTNVDFIKKPTQEQINKILSVSRGREVYADKDQKLGETYNTVSTLELPAYGPDKVEKLKSFLESE